MCWKGKNAHFSHIRGGLVQDQGKANLTQFNIVHQRRVEVRDSEADLAIANGLGRDPSAHASRAAVSIFRVMSWFVIGNSSPGLHLHWS